MLWIDGEEIPAGTCLYQGGYINGKDERLDPCHRYLIGNNRTKRGLSNDPDETQKVSTEMEEGLKAE